VAVSRKEAIRAFKERKTPRGIFAVRCSATASVWVDSAMDLDAAENRTWFALRLGDRFLDPPIGAQFQEHGRDVFSFEILEKLEDDVTPMAVRGLLKDKKAEWVGKLGARRLSPG
jgi:hypothetical protein